MKKTAFWFCLLTVGVLSLLPTEYLPRQTFNIWDKAQHALGFAALAALCLNAYPRHKPYQLALGLLVFGAAIECAQAATGWRHGEWLDLLADGIGIAFGMLVWTWRPWALARAD
ncbi:VanZ family protein [Hydrogenophaga sp.]|uniref:VanZ family protein n=1 Tax=Hydrogenophaga sp. TaxID=1904254 RepID=UPI0035670106